MVSGRPDQPDKRILIVDGGKPSVDVALDPTRHTVRVIFLTSTKGHSSEDDPRAPLKWSDVKVIYSDRISHHYLL
jgi:hypothetical protein